MIQEETFVRIKEADIAAVFLELEAIDHILTAMLGMEQKSYHDAAVTNVRNLQMRIRRAKYLLPDLSPEPPF